MYKIIELVNNIDIFYLEVPRGSVFSLVKLESHIFLYLVDPFHHILYNPSILRTLPNEFLPVDFLIA